MHKYNINIASLNCLKAEIQKILDHESSGLEHNFGSIGTLVRDCFGRNVPKELIAKCHNDFFLFEDDGSHLAFKSKPGESAKELQDRFQRPYHLC